MLGTLDHIGIAVPDLSEGLRLYVEGLGLKLGHIEVVKSEGVRVAMLHSGKTRVELLEPLNEGSPIAKFLGKGKTGVHHLAFSVENIEEVCADYRGKGIKLIEPAPRNGAGGCKVAFIHPKSAAGVLVELVERPK